MSDTTEFPRRRNVDRWTPAERAIGAALDAVEALPADERLTRAVILLGHAQDAVADYVDGVGVEGRATDPSEAPYPLAAPRVWPENFWREVWHQDCPEGRPDPPMIHHRQYAQIEDGSHLRLYECTRCGVKAWAGLDAGRRVVSRRFEDLTPEPR